jgi:long-subunit fatty acid transport protein
MTEIIEDTNITDNDGFLGETIFTVSEDPQNGYQNFTGFSAPRQATNYDLRQPSKLTASAAIIFGKSGLISFDYITRNFQGLNINSAFDDFSAENQFFDNNLRRTNSFNVGTEWRFSRLSLRGGYSYQESPDANALDADNLERYSAGNCG